MTARGGRATPKNNQYAPVTVTGAKTTAGVDAPCGAGG
jgi:hypothetical protein